MVTKAGANFKQDLHVLQLSLRNSTLYFIWRCLVLQPCSPKLSDWAPNAFERMYLICSPLDESQIEGSFLGFLHTLQVPSFLLSNRTSLWSCSPQLGASWSRKVTSAGASEENATPNADSAYYIVANSNRPKASPGYLLPPAVLLLQVGFCKFTSALDFMMWKRKKGTKLPLSSFPNYL